MSAPDEFVRRWFEEVWNQSSPLAIDQLMAPKAKLHGLPEPPALGPDGFKQVFHQFKGTFPDLHVDVIKTVVEGRSVAAVCHVTGTHTGPGMGAPSGKKIDFSGIVMMDVVDGRWEEAWNFFDFPRMYQQIGWSP